MGRRKIEIKFIGDDRNRSVTFIKRKNGLFKKAHELSVLTGAKVTVHVEDVKERHFDFKSTNLGGANDEQEFQSEDEDEDQSSLEEVKVEDSTENLESYHNATASSAVRKEGTTKPGHRRTQSSVHLSPSSTFVPTHSRRSSGQPYPPRSPGNVNLQTPNSGHNRRPASMDFSMTSPYNNGSHPAGGPTRKYSIPSTALDYQQVQGPRHSSNPAQMFGMTPYQNTTQVYHHNNSSQQSIPQSYNSYESPQLPSPSQMSSRYSGGANSNGPSASHSQQHLPMYHSNLAPITDRPMDSARLPEQDTYSSYLPPRPSNYEFMDDDANDHDYEAMATQASTPGNYDSFSTNTSVTNLNQMTAQQNRNFNLGLGLNVPNQMASWYNHRLPTDTMHSSQRNSQHQHQQHQSDNHPLYSNSSVSQSTPNLAWTMNQSTRR